MLRSPARRPPAIWPDIYLRRGLAALLRARGGSQKAADLRSRGGETRALALILEFVELRSELGIQASYEFQHG